MDFTSISAATVFKQAGGADTPRQGLARPAFAPPSDAPADERLRAVALELEATFLAEMLKHSGVGKPLQTFGGGPGEEAFSSFLVQEYAAQITDRGGLGLAEKIYRSLKSSTPIEGQ